MAENATDQKPAPPSGSQELVKQVQQLIMLSIGLKFEEKDALIKKLPSLNDSQLTQLRGVFEEENTRKEEMLSDFFSKNPELYPEFERFSKDHVNAIYRDVEDGEKPNEASRMEELLQTSF